MNVFTVKALKENRVTIEELLLLEMNGGNRTMQFYLYCVGLSKEGPWGQKKAISKVFEAVNNYNHPIRKLIMNLLQFLKWWYYLLRNWQWPFTDCFDELKILMLFTSDQFGQENNKSMAHRMCIGEPCACLLPMCTCLEPKSGFYGQ